VLPVDAASEQLGALLVGMQRRLCSELPERVELFLQPGENDDEASLFAFLRDDLPRFQPTEYMARSTNLLTVATIILCNSQAFTALFSMYDPLLVTDTFNSAELQLGLDAASVFWPLGPMLLSTLLSATLARRVAAQLYGVQISQVPLPSASAGHLGSVWSPHDFLPTQRCSFDIAAAGPSAMLLVSACLAGYGALNVAGLDPSDAPYRLNAIQLPTAIAAALGYSVPAAGEEPLLTLASAGLPQLPGPEGPLVPVDAFLLGGAAGLVVASVNLLPVGGFDGYAVARAAFGPKIATVLELLSLGALCIEVGRDDVRGVFASEVILVWMLQWIFANRRDEAMPPKDSVSSPGLERQALAAALLAASALILMPPG